MPCKAESSLSWWAAPGVVHRGTRTRDTQTFMFSQEIASPSKRRSVNQRTRSWLRVEHCFDLKPRILHLPRIIIRGNISRLYTRNGFTIYGFNHKMGFVWRKFLYFVSLIRRDGGYIEYYLGILFHFNEIKFASNIWNACFYSVILKQHRYIFLCTNNKSLIRNPFLLLY